MMAQRLYVIKKNKRYVCDVEKSCSFTKNINKAALFKTKRSANDAILTNETIVKVQTNKSGKITEV